MSEESEECAGKKGLLTKEKLLNMIRNLLKTDHPLEFLMNLKKKDLEDLTACIRESVDRREE